MYAKPIALAAAMLLVLSGCADSHEKVVTDGLDVMSDMADILAGIDDKASAEAAVPKVEALGTRMKKIAERAEKLGELSVEQQQALLEKHKDQIEKIKSKVQSSTMQLFGNQEAAMVIFPALQGLASPPKILETAMGDGEATPGGDFPSDADFSFPDSEAMDGETPAFEGGPAFGPDAEGTIRNPFESDTEAPPNADPEPN